MTPEQFLVRCPALWHVAAPGSWASIKETGLRTAAQLIDGADLPEDERAALHETPRKTEARLQVGGTEVVLRDQGALFKADLSGVLEPEVTVADWVRLLNKRVYLYADQVAMRKALDRLVASDGAQEVITFSPRRLVDAARLQLELSASNAGAMTKRSDPYKGRDAFRSISRYPDRRPAEVTIVDGLDDLAPIVRAELHGADGSRTVLT